MTVTNNTMNIIATTNNKTNDDASTCSLSPPEGSQQQQQQLQPHQRSWMMLPEDFEPTETEVVLGRGRKVYNHCGNIRFREMIKPYLAEYQHATNKNRKTAILASVVDLVVSNSPPDVGGFVKFDPATKRWSQVDNTAKRTTCAQTFRDALSTNYKSSKQAKQMRRSKAKQVSSSSTLAPTTLITAQQWQGRAARAADQESSQKKVKPSSTCLALPTNHERRGSALLMGALEESLSLLDTSDCLAFLLSPTADDEEEVAALAACTVNNDNSSCSGFVTGDAVMSSWLSYLADQVVDIDSDPFEPTPISTTTSTAIAPEIISCWNF